MTLIDIGDAFQERQTGRTTKLINSIPEEGAVVIVSSYQNVEIFKGLILSIKGKRILDRCQVIAFTDSLRGLSGPVLVDHAVIDSTNITIKELMDMSRQIALMTNRPKITRRIYTLRTKYVNGEETVRYTDDINVTSNIVTEALNPSPLSPLYGLQIESLSITT